MVAENEKVLELVTLFEKRNLEKLELMQELTEICGVSFLEEITRGLLK